MSTLPDLGAQRAALRTTLEQVIGRYPNTDAARIAGDRLRSIQVGQLR